MINSNKEQALTAFIDELLHESQEKSTRDFFYNTMVPFLEEQQNQRGGETVFLPSGNNHEIIMTAASNNTGGNGNHTGCAGTYPVSGYTRSDGTEVDGYMRTCGAAHAGQESENEHEVAEEKNTILTGGIETNVYMDDESDNTVEPIPAAEPAKSDETNKKTESITQRSKTSSGTITETQPKKSSSDKLTPEEAFQKVAAQSGIPFGKLEPLKEYYQISLDLYDRKFNIKNNDHNKFYKFSNIPHTVNKNAIIDKLNNTKDFDKSNLNNILVVVPQENSPLVDALKNSEQVKELIKRKYQNIIDGDRIQTSLEFKKPRFNDIFDNPEKVNLYGVLHRVSIYDMKQNSNGTISLVIVDYFDFDHWEANESDEAIDTVIKRINNNAHQQQNKGKLNPYVLYIPIVLTKKELEN